jgi:DNA-directed RNA polymerase subunit beta'
MVESTVGRFIFNDAIPQGLGFVDRSVPGNEVHTLEIDQLVDKKLIGKIIDRCFRLYGNTETAIVLDRIKELGFKYSTRGAITISMSDMIIPEEKAELLSKGMKT